MTKFAGKIQSTFYYMVKAHQEKQAKNLKLIETQNYLCGDLRGWWGWWDRTGRKL